MTKTFQPGSIQTNTFQADTLLANAFHGSYLPEDVTFLLKPISIEMTSVADKEERIQSGKSHYSEMLSPESLPSASYLEVFHGAFARNRERFAADICRLARIIAARVSGPVTLVSLARAGTPVGVLLRRTLTRHLGRAARHYSLSIIRDRGIDVTALDYILDNGNSENSIVFVDGWTGKGVIRQELLAAIQVYNAARSTRLSPDLYVVADLCGVAGAAASCEDYLIPSSVLNATVSGLVSRSVLSERYVGPGDFHGCAYYAEFMEQDLSRWFVDALTEDMNVAQQNFAGSPSDHDAAGVGVGFTEADKTALRQKSQKFMEDTMRRYNVRNVNYVKPGIGEATRVLLRRSPHLVLVRDPDSPDVRHLLLLAKEKNVPVTIAPDLPYEAAALIRDLLL